jgi:Tol biopolymer transport system component
VERPRNPRRREPQRWRAGIVLIRIAGLAFAVLVTTVVAADAQSFGRNKVHYDDLDFRILETPHFNIYYYPEEHDASVEAGRLAERWYARLSKALDFTFTERQPIVLYASHSQFIQTNIIPDFLGEGIGGVTEHDKGRVVLPFAAGLGETDHVLGHELVHAFQRQIIRKSGRSIEMLPLWFLEGMAEYLSVGQIDGNTAMWLRDASEQHKLPRIDQLSNPKWFPYRYGQALWAYLAGRFGEDVVAKCLRSGAKGGAIGRLVSVTGVDANTLSKGWHESIQQMSATTDGAQPRKPSPAIVTTKNGGHYNIGPSLSPDGKSMVFLSERDLLSIDVYLADAETGAIRRKIVETAGDPHFESLQFIESAGAWDPGGRRFVLAARTGGQAVLSILDVRSGDIEREIPIREVDQVFGPTWSPDGKRIAFAGLKGGLSDLYEVNVETSHVRALTSDAFADLQPSWSPDGRSIAFSTDRFSSSLETLTFGNFRLASIDVESRAITELPSVPDAKNIDPHWSGDGASLYFIADAGRVSNVYRLDVADETIYQVTRETTGVSGITSLSPALSVAAQADRAAFSVYRNGGYEIHAIDLKSDTIQATAPVVAAGATPASNPMPLAGALSVPVLDLPNGQAFATKPYRSGLSLDRMVQPYVSAGGGSTGGFVRAGVGLTFADMLGDRQLQTAIQVGKGVDDFIGEAAYLNMRSRWTWGVIGEQVPWLIGAIQQPATLSADRQTVTAQADVFRQIHRDVAGVAIYPFSGAKRLELSVGGQSITYDRESTIGSFSPITGSLLNSSTSTTTAAPTAYLAETSAAFVYDSSEFGPSSPILGQRYRLAISPSFGSMSFATVTADYRKYVMPIRPLTIAMRAMYLGRYGSGAEDPRLLPLAWTLRDLVRGYGDTGPIVGGLSYLTAPRMLIANVEARFPIPGIFTGSMQPLGLPIEGLFFSDAGQFWTPSSLTGSTPPMLRSIGAGVRLTAAGLVFELDAARPIDNVSTGWRFAFNFRPGF